jgi:drug/metabolite transporter (DMT)-like permease
MSFFTAMHAQIVLFAGYVLCFIVLNAIAFLISLFYRKKFHHPSPRWGFIAAIACAFLSCVLLSGERNGAGASQSIGLLSLVGSALASIFSTARLFYVMQRVRK